MLALALALLAADAAPAKVSAFEQYQSASETTCLGRTDKVFETPDSWSEGGYTFKIAGARAEVHAEARPKEARLGLLAAVKDFSPETQANLTTFVAAFKKAGVSAIIVGGD